jgi:hypothetical protein
MSVILLRDVLPGTPLDVDTYVATASWPGAYELRADLLQIGVGSLERCGFTPLVLPARLAEKKKGLPEGSYWMSCRGCSLRDGRLACQCRNGAGEWI